jgi:signal transduction histidine kinase
MLVSSENIRGGDRRKPSRSSLHGSWFLYITVSTVSSSRDTGPGVLPEIRSKLFQPFVTAGKRNGLGLGLAFTRQTVLEHGGDL